MTNQICTICEFCKTPFYRYPAFHRHAENRGSKIRFCSVKCTNEGKKTGLVAGKPHTGKTLTCEACKTEFYRPKSMIESGKNRFCSEPCRMQGYELGLIDRTGPRPNRMLGQEIACVICNSTIYRKKSMIERNIDKTCGNRKCIHAYSRSLWNLPPKENPMLDKPKTNRKYRKENFSASQRRAWLGTECIRCGSTENLALDHILAVCNGGKAEKENSQTLCQPCNNWKATNVDRRLVKQPSKGAFKG